MTRRRLSAPSARVMPRLDRGIQREKLLREHLDCRVEPGNDPVP